jgi:hypothetical protein
MNGGEFLEEGLYFMKLVCYFVTVLETDEIYLTILSSEARAAYIDFRYDKIITSYRGAPVSVTVFKIQQLFVVQSCLLGCTAV